MSLLLIKTIHLLGFAGCLSASFAKNALLARHREIRGRNLWRFVIFDKVSGISAAMILASGIVMAGWVAKPGEIYMNSGLFWAKVLLFTLASTAVLMTKPVLRRARAEGVLEPRQALRKIFAFDLMSIALIAVMGRLLAISG